MTGVADDGTKFVHDVEINPMLMSVQTMEYEMEKARTRIQKDLDHYASTLQRQDAPDVPVPPVRDEG